MSRAVFVTVVLPLLVVALNYVIAAIRGDGSVGMTYKEWLDTQPYHVDSEGHVIVNQKMLLEDIARLRAEIAAPTTEKETPR